VDGCRARRRGTSGPWGEFLDHALDAANAMALVWGVALVAGDAVRPAVAVMTMAATGLATLATWAEQRATGEAVLGLVGPVEAAVFAVGLMLGCGVSGSGLAAEVVAGFSWAEMGFIAGGLGALATAWAAQRRARAIRGEMVRGAAVMAAMLAAGAAGLPWTIVGLGLAGLTADGAARAIARHLGADVPGKIDPWAAALLLAGACIPTVRVPVVGLAAVWLGLRVVLVWRAAARLRAEVQWSGQSPA